MRTNASIKAHYEEGHDYTSDGFEENDCILTYLSYGLAPEYKTVLEIGCGDGQMAYEIHCIGNPIIAIDYIDADWPKDQGPKFQVGDFKKIKSEFRTIVIKGVLEHMDSPLDTLEFIAENFKPGQIITSSPSFLNPRGYIWMALQYLFDYEMSLADLHFILPSDMEAWAEKIGYDIEYKSVDQDWGHGERLIEDFKKRLPKVFKNIEADIPKFMEWLEKTLPYASHTDSSGATIVYNLRRK